MGILSTENVLRELAYASDHSQSREELLNEIASILEVNFGDINGDLYLNEAEQYNKVVKHLRLDILDVERYIEENDCKCVSNPRAFVRDRIPSDDGLLSNEIFGLTPDERAGTFGYIDLHGIFLDPSCFKAWIRIDSKIRNVVHGIGTYRVDEEGQIVEDPAGKTGIRWLYSVKDKIKFKKKESISRDISRQYVESNRDKMWITKYIVIPPFYRDKNVSSSSSKIVGLGGVNKLYSDLIISTNALKETQDYLFDPSNTMYGRVQEIILNIYDWFCGNTNKNIKTDMGSGLSGKFGLIQGAALSKTANYTSRLVISAPELKVNSPKDLMVDFDKSAVPIATCMTNFKDFVIFHCKRFFENEFQGKTTYPVYDEKTGKVEYEELDDPMIAFSDERIKHEMERFLHGYNNRFVPIEVPLANPRKGKNPYMMFTGNLDEPNTHPESIFHRRLTWLDVFFIATTEATTNKQVLITRFPIDSYTNQFTTGVIVSSTKETEPMYINGKYYKYYPKIRETDMGIDTSNKFIDTLRFSNVYLPGIGGDYDGDQCSIKGVYTTEANEELKEFMYSKQNFVNFGCSPSRASEGDVAQAVFALTRVLSDTKLTENIQFG